MEKNIRRKLFWREPWKKKRDEEVRLIGIAGVGRGTGVTHLTIQTANYLSSYKQRKTAVIEWNGHGDFKRIEQTVKKFWNVKQQSFGKKFIWLDVDYYPQGDARILAKCMDGTYDEIIIDFGSLESSVLTEWLRCGTKIVTAALVEWKLKTFLEFLVKEEQRKRQCIYVTTFGSEDIRVEIEKQFHIPLIRIPLSVDAFSVDQRAIDWFEGILQ